MAEFKLNCGETFTLNTCPFDERGQAVFELVDEGIREGESANAYVRRAVLAILKACNPDVVPKLVMPDWPMLCHRFDEILKTAVGDLVDRDDSPKNADAPATSEDGCGQDSAAEG